MQTRSYSGGWAHSPWRSNPDRLHSRAVCNFSVTMIHAHITYESHISQRRVSLWCKRVIFIVEDHTGFNARHALRKIVANCRIRESKKKIWLKLHSNKHRQYNEELGITYMLIHFDNQSFDKKNGTISM